MESGKVSHIICVPFAIAFVNGKNSKRVKNWTYHGLIHWNVQQCFLCSLGCDTNTLCFCWRQEWQKRIPMGKEQVKLYTPASLSLLSMISPFFIFLRKMPFVCVQWLEKFIGGASNESKILNSGNCHFKNIFGFESQKGCLRMRYLKWDSQEILAWYNLVQEFLVSVSHLEHDKNNNICF